MSRRRQLICAAVFLASINGFLPAAEPRLVSLAPNITELIFELGFSPYLVGRSSACDFPAAAAQLPVAGDFGKPSMEALLALKPTALLVSDVESKAVLEGIRERGIETLSLPCENWSQLADAAIRIAAVCGDESRGRAWAANLTNRVAMIARATGEASGNRPSVYVEIWGDPMTTAGRDSFLAEIIRTAGGTNIGDVLDGRYVAVNPEWVLAENPDVILLGYMPASAAPDEAQLANRIGWRDMKAIRDGRVVRGIPADLILRPGPRLLQGCEQLALALKRAPEEEEPAPDALVADAECARAIREYRLWRLLLGACVGAGLAVAGLIMQGVLRNPLADPYILGLSAGGGLGVAAGITLGAAAPWTLPLAGFSGALASLVIVLLLSRAARGSGSTLLLAGVAWSALCSSLLMLLVNHWQGAGLHNVFWWFLGDLQVNQRLIVVVVGGLVLAGLFIATLFSRAITILAMGDELTALLGLTPERLRYLLLAVATLLAGSCVAAAGVIGFVGLVAPHIARRMVGSGHRWLVPATALIGAAWVIGADALGRAIAYPREWPVGVVCALAGAPFFLALLRRGAGASWK